MNDLMEFLRARLAEDEAVARAATDGPWSVDNEGYPEAIYGPAHEPVIAGDRWGGEASVFDTEADAHHIARHDPARILAEVGGKRGVLRETFQYVAKIDGEWGCCHSAEAIERGECEDYPPDELPTVRLLALPYASHPDYRVEWAPESD